MSFSHFTTIQEIGQLVISDTEYIRFTIEKFNDYTYASIRKYSKRDNLVMPTKNGVTISWPIISRLTPFITQLSNANFKESPIGKFAKNPGHFLLFSIIKKDKYFYLKIEEHLTLKKSTTWINIPLTQIADIKQFFSLFNNYASQQIDDDF